MLQKADLWAEKIVSGDCRAVLYGGGKTGKQVYSFLKSNAIDVYAFCDSNPALWGQEILDRKVCMGLDNLLQENQEVVFIITVAHRYYSDIIRTLEAHEGANYLLWEEFSSSIAVKRHVYKADGICNFSSKKIALYTCITDGYDQFEEQRVQIPNCDYFIISDKAVNSSGNMENILLNDVVPSNIKNARLQNRYCKMHGHTIFRDYQYSIYLDGNVELLQDISEYLYLSGESGVAFYQHEIRDCIYDEGIAVMLLDKADAKQVKAQLKEYAEQGMPAKYGLLAGGVIFRDHSKNWGNQIMENWWKEYLRWPTRDQISLMYVLWSMGVRMLDIGIVAEGKSRFCDNKIFWREHLASVSERK